MNDRERESAVVVLLDHCAFVIMESKQQKKIPGATWHAVWLVGEKDDWADGPAGLYILLTDSHGHGALCCSKSTYLSSYKNMYLCIILYKI